MKLLMFFLFLMLGFNQSFSQSHNNEWVINDTIKQEYLYNIPRGSLSSAYFMKVSFVDEGRQQVYSVVPKSNLMQYFGKKLNITGDVLENYIDSIILNKVTFPLKDSLNIGGYASFDEKNNSYYSAFYKIDTDSLNILKKSAVSEVLRKYFNNDGRIKPLYANSREVYFTLLAYLFDNYIEIDEIGGLKINPFTVLRLKELKIL